MVGNYLAKLKLTLHEISICTSLCEPCHSTTGMFTKTTTTGTFSRILWNIIEINNNKSNHLDLGLCNSDHKTARQLLFHYGKCYHNWTPGNTQIFQLISNVQFVQEWYILSAFDLKESELLKHFVVEQNLLVTTCWHSKLDTIDPSPKWRPKIQIS